MYDALQRNSFIVWKRGEIGKESFQQKLKDRESDLFQVEYRLLHKWYCVMVLRNV